MPKPRTIAIWVVAGELVLTAIACSDLSRRPHAPRHHPEIVQTGDPATPFITASAGK